MNAAPAGLRDVSAPAGAAATSVVLRSSWLLSLDAVVSLCAAKVAKSASDKAQTAARLDTWRGFVTQYGADSRHLLCRELRSTTLAQSRPTTATGRTESSAMSQSASYRRYEVSSLRPALRGASDAGPRDAHNDLHRRLATAAVPADEIAIASRGPGWSPR